MNDSEAIRLEIQQLIADMKSIQLATISSDGKPEASYSPFLYRSPDFFIFVSALATHTNNLLTNACCSMMLIEDESKTANIHGRRRLVVYCKVDLIERETEDGQSILDKMAMHLGKTISVIRQLPDFFLFRLQPTGGRYVKGFGAAYKTDSTFTKIELIRGR